MTTRQRLEEKGMNINTIIGVATIVGMVATGVFFIAPLRTLPSDLKEISNEQQSMKQSQAVQTVALKTLAEVAGDTKTMRRDVDVNGSRIQDILRRLERLESRP